MARVLAVDLGQGDKGAAIVGPGFDLRQGVDSRLVLHDRAGTDSSGEQVPGADGSAQETGRIFQQLLRVELQAHQGFNPAQAVTKQKAGPFHGAEQVGDGGKAAAGQVGKEESWPLMQVDAALDCACKQVRVNRLVDAEQLATSFKIADSLPEVFRSP